MPHAKCEQCLHYLEFFSGNSGRLMERCGCGVRPLTVSVLRLPPDVPKVKRERPQESFVCTGCGADAERVAGSRRTWCQEDRCVAEARSTAGRQGGRRRGIRILSAADRDLLNTQEGLL